MTLLESLDRAVQLVSRSHPCAVVGGLAVSVRAEPRFTRDADLAVAVANDEGAESVVAAMVVTGYRLEWSLEQTTFDRLSGVRLIDEDETSIDLLFASSGIEHEITAAAEVVEIVPGVRLPVASCGHLIALKLLSVSEGRETDTADLRSLAAVAIEADWQAAEEAVALITDRGYHRQRDLRSALDTLHNSYGRRR